MTSLFPFSFPLPTAFYLTLLVLTLVVHVVFMNYVLAGAAYLAFVSLFPGRSRRLADGTVATVLRDWMPFAISAAITAGIAPLLFLQILYKANFYTANLLLFHRWMAILPVLIVGSYLAYVLKSKGIIVWPAIVRAAVGVGMLLCLGFVAYSWTENHLLSLESQKTWSEFYAAESIVYRNAQILPRLGVWVLGALATMSLLAAWQIWSADRRAGACGQAACATGPDSAASSCGVTPRSGPGTVRLLAGMSIAGLIGAGLCAVAYLAMPDTAAPGGHAPFAAVAGPMAVPYGVVAILGVAVQLAGWVMMFRSGKLCPKMLGMNSAACFLAILGATVAREAVRIQSIDLEALYPQHAQAAQVGGLTVFLAFAMINGVLVALCFRLVKRGRIAPAAA